MPIGTTRPNIPESTANSATQRIDFDALWDFDRPDESERRFCEVLQSAPDDVAYRTELLTQIARSQGLQRKFDQAHTTLDRAEAMLTDDVARARARYWLERGRVFNSSRQPDRAVPLTSAYRLLSQDPWLVENEPARLERLKQSGKQAC